MHHSQIATSHGLEWRQGHEHACGKCGGNFAAANQSHRLGNSCLSRTDDRLGGHQTTGSEFAILHQTTQVVGFFFIHEFKNRLGASLWQVGHEVGGVIRFHQVKNLGGTLVVELLNNVDLLFFWQLFEHVGEALIIELFGNLNHALVRQVKQCARQVGWAQFRIGGNQLLCALALGSGSLFDGLLPSRKKRCTARKRRSANLWATQK